MLNDDVKDIGKLISSLKNHKEFEFWLEDECTKKLIDIVDTELHSHLTNRPGNKEEYDYWASALECFKYIAEILTFEEREEIEDESDS